MDERAKRDRPATNPGGMVCDKCSEVFIGEEWHQFCAICVAEIAEKIAAGVPYVNQVVNELQVKNQKATTTK